MNGLKCPNCNLVNMTSATQCHRCNTSLTNLPPTAQVSVPVEETFQAKAFASQQTPNNIPQDNELGRKTFFWYRVYMGFMTALYVAVTVFGGLAIYLSQNVANNAREAEEFLINGIVCFIVGIPLSLAFAIGLFLPRKSWNWIVGFVYIAIGLTSCCLLPATIPLLIFWIKPETKAFFGRN